MNSLPPRSKMSRKGLTLVEIVAALVLAATVLSTALVGYSRSVRQERLAMERLEAIDLADELLADWVGPQGSFPASSSQQRLEGRIERHPGWLWRISPMPSRTPTIDIPFEVDRHRLEILIEANEERSERQLVMVDFVSRIGTKPELLRGGNLP